MDDNNQSNNNQAPLAEPEAQEEQTEQKQEQSENAESNQVAEEAKQASDLPSEVPSELAGSDQSEVVIPQDDNSQSPQPTEDQTQAVTEPVDTAAKETAAEENQTPEGEQANDELAGEETTAAEDAQALEDSSSDDPNAKWYVVHTYSGHENKVATALKQRVESEHLENKILDVLVPTQDKIEIRSGKKNTVKEKIFPGYILVKMILDDNSWLAVRTTQGVTGFVGIGNKPTPIPTQEVKTIVRFMTQGAAPTFKDVFMVDDTVKIIDGPFSEFIGKVDSVDKEHGKVRVLVSIFGRETPVELDFLQVQKL